MSSLRYRWYLLFGVGLLALAGWMLPLGDDWSYLTAPNPDFGWRSLLPGVNFWRPFDALLGGALGRCPWAFPWLNRVIVVLGHVLNVAMVGRVVEKLSPSAERFQTKLAMGFFALSSAAAAVVLNTDSVNQVWSFFFGVCALNVVLGDGTGRGLVRAGGLVFVSMLFKESGVSWLGVMMCVICFGDAREDVRTKVSRTAKAAGLGVLLLLVYFGLRFGLKGGMALGEGRDYALGFSLEKFVADLATNIVPSLTAIDILAVVCHKWWIVVCTGVLSAAFWVMALGGAVRRMLRGDEELKRWIVMCAVVAVALAFPHCFFRNLHPAEMHFYPVLFAGALVVSRFQSSSQRMKLGVCGVMLALFAAGWCDKLGEAYAYGARTEALLDRIKSRAFDFAKPVYLVVEEGRSVCRYSGFTQSAAHGIYFGAALRSLNGWRPVECHLVLSALEVPEGAQMETIR